MTRLLFMMFGVAMALASATAAAYSSPALYAADPARTGGAGGRVFSGSPADGFTCAVCHTAPAPAMPDIRGWPTRDYEPGATYQIEIGWPEEHFGVVLEVTDRAGAPIGELHLPPGGGVVPDERCAGGSRAAELIELPDTRTAVAVGDCGSHLLRVQWTAPPEHVPGALHVATVVGDGDGTPAGDGAAVRTLPTGPEVETSGCSIVGGGIGAWLWLLLLRRRRGAALVVLLSLGAACARVQPHQRGRLAQPDMQLGGDADLNAGPEHALEYREGSAGGLGGGGGGCGCN
jgi:hypothetical protein